MPSLPRVNKAKRTEADKHGGRWLEEGQNATNRGSAMKQSIFIRRWIILVLLLMISITFLFLQLLSLKAIDNTVSAIALFSLGALRTTSAVLTFSY